MCPNCRAFITTDDRVCPYCDAKVGPRAIDRRSPSDIGGIIPGAQFTTAMILLINIALFVATMIYSMKGTGGGFSMNVDGRTLTLFGAKNALLILFAGEWWRLVTAGFLHGGLFHILMNSWALYSLGGQVEELFGTARYIVFYFVATVAGFLASLYISPRALSIGASAGVFGLIGVMIAFGMQHKTAMGQAVRSHYTQWAVYGIVMGLLPGFAVDNAAHIGGLAAGFALSWFGGTPKLYQSWRDTAWKAAAGISLLLTALSFLLMALRFLSSAPAAAPGFLAF
jgi:rhomboid protease GluP